jgi:hypothetical protein
MIRFIEDKKTDSSSMWSSTGLAETKRARQRVAEVTSYQDIPVADAVNRLSAEAQGKSIQCHQGHIMGSGFMDARYSFVRVSGSELRFLDSKNLNNRMSIYLRDVVKVDMGEDSEVNFITFRFDLNDRTFISVTLAA